MKLATIRDGSRNGQLAVVSRDLKTAHLADGIAPTLQAALDDWAFIAPQLIELSHGLNGGRVKRSFDFDPGACMAPLPRAYQRASGWAYLHHLELLRQARGGATLDTASDEPLMHQCASDVLAGAGDDIVLAHEAWGIDVEAGLAVITDDVPMGATPDQAHSQVRLLTLVNDVVLRNLADPELARGLGYVQSRPASSFSPVAVTPDELGDAWKGGMVHLPLRVTLNGKLLGQPQAGADLAFNFPKLLAHLCKTRAAGAGTIMGTGPVSNRDAARGVACIAEKRAREMLADGVASTPFMLFGDTIRIEMLDAAGKTVFGAIEQIVKQTVVKAPEARRGRSDPGQSGR